jgi:membrane protein insertase Oxa1/YidC/SpoIIIJ
MKKMQKLAPKMNAIRDKYKKAKSDAAQRQKMNEELMKLYQSEATTR